MAVTAYIWAGMSVRVIVYILGGGGFLVRVTQKDCIIWPDQSLNKASMLKSLVLMSCAFVLAQPFMAFVQYCRPHFTQKACQPNGMDFKYFPMVLHALICVSFGQCYQEITSLIFLPCWDLNLVFIFGMLALKVLGHKPI